MGILLTSSFNFQPPLEIKHKKMEGGGGGGEEERENIIKK